VMGECPEVVELFAAQLHKNVDGAPEFQDTAYH